MIIKFLKNTNKIVSLDSILSRLVIVSKDFRQLIIKLIIRVRWRLLLIRHVAHFRLVEIDFPATARRRRRRSHLLLLVDVNIDSRFQIVARDFSKVGKLFEDVELAFVLVQGPAKANFLLVLKYIWKCFYFPATSLNENLK